MPAIHRQGRAARPLKVQPPRGYGLNFTNTTPELTGYDAYKITLYVDFALTSLTLVDPSLPPPVLAIHPASPGNVTLSWTPATDTNWVLQERINLTTGAWTNAPSGWTNPVTVPATLPTKFYRLFKP